MTRRLARRRSTRTHRLESRRQRQRRKGKEEEVTTRQQADQWAEEQYLDGLDEVLKLRDEYEELRRTNQMDFYEPYPYQLTFP